MKFIKGTAASPGYAIGEAFVLSFEEFQVRRTEISADQIDGEIQRVNNAFRHAVKHLNSNISQWTKKLEPMVLRVFEGYVVMLEDPSFREGIAAIVRNSRVNAEYAIQQYTRQKIKIFAEAGMHKVSGRLENDLVEIEQALLKALAGPTKSKPAIFNKPAILVATDLTPARTAGLDKNLVLGIITEKGSRTSHSAIVASSMGIPAVVAAEGAGTEILTGDTLILDGNSGTIIINPAEDTMKRYRAQQVAFNATSKKLIKKYQQVPAVTKDNQQLAIFANIEFPTEAEFAMKNGADGIGLFRTEFLFSDAASYTDVDKHVEAYRTALQQCAGKPVTIRTLDFGADKIPLDGMPAESNPFLGVRAIRLCFERQDIFKAQIKALLLARSSGNLKIMIPMISSVHEIHRTKEIFRMVYNELYKHGTGFHSKSAGVEALPSIGIMLEVPSALMTLDIMVKDVDFVSIGTNDLIAYLLAVDRTNPKLAGLYQPSHPAVIRGLKQAISTCNNAGKQVSVCGEMASDIVFTYLLIGLGLRTFSAAIPVIPELKRVISGVTIRECEQIAEKAMAMEDAAKCYEMLRQELSKRITELVL